MPATVNRIVVIHGRYKVLTGRDAPRCVLGGNGCVKGINDYVGYARDAVSAKDFRQGQTIVMHGKSVMIKETKIRAPRVSQRGDTLTYLVNSFRQKQDRTITDVIKKMPGLQVGEDGTLTYTIKESHKTAIY